MTPEFDRVVILADESANWKIGGLRQLERLALALDEFARSLSTPRKIDIIIFWHPGIAVQKRWQPNNPRLMRCRFVEGLANGGGARFVSTRLLVKRSGIDRLLSQVSSVGFDPAIDDKSAVWHDLSRRIQDQCADPRDFSSQREAWRYLAEPREIPAAERWLLRRSGKSRDGFISRYVNRPVSRTVSRFLLRTPMTPNLWTVLITFFPILGFLFLIRGTYAGFVIGAALCNVHSILDGCDGEIARAKYLDSDKGPGVDAFGDLIALLLFSIGLGLGLSRSAQHAVSHWIFLTEGILTAVFIAMRLGPNHVLDMFRRGSKAVAFSKDDEWLSRSGGRIFGKRITSLGFELTKRDVVFSTFLIVAALGLARWILHFLFIFAVATFTLSWSGRVRRETIA